MSGLFDQWKLLLPLVLGGLSVWMLMPRDGRRPWLLAGLCGASALLSLSNLFPGTGDELVLEVLFYLFGAGAIVSGTLMITDRNPAHAALWFAVATLSVCGLFLLNAAPFLAAATVVVYAGAIVVTFLFVIMLAQQEGEASYDRRAFQPLLATVGGFLLLGGMLYGLQEWGGLARQPVEVDARTAQFVRPPADRQANPYSVPREGDLGSLRAVGRSMFGDYLYTVELAGTVLLIAAIAAIALAPRRSQGTL